MSEKEQKLSDKMYL